MKLGCVFSFLLLLSGLSSIESQQNAFDHFWFVLTWPPTFCRTNPCYGHANIARFTIHGLWPVNKRGDTLHYPVQVYADRRWFKYTSSPLVTGLRKYWPSLSRKRANEIFWLHEWNTHGSMQAKLIPKDYFQNAVSITKKAGDIVTALKWKEVKPSATKNYSSTEFREALKSVTGTDRVMLICNTTTHALRELRICVDRRATHFIPCNANEMRKRSCDQGPPFKFPPP